MYQLAAGEERMPEYSARRLSAFNSVMPKELYTQHGNKLGLKSKSERASL